MTAKTTVTLTPQQQAIVAHNLGPALVFAVAGAGKTTAMVHRIARLVREGVFAPEQILATSFNKAANIEIETRLKQHPGCTRVQIKTLHALGYLIVREAHQRKLLPHIRPESIREGVDNLDRQLLYKTLGEARKRRVRYADELNRLDHDDFLNYVGACKGNLHYADLDIAKLPAEARGIAKQARPPAGLAWYLDLYRIYEQMRRQEGWLTFDDMLMTGWEVLTRHEEILEQARRQHQCVLVDEFQDINLAQSEILDRVTWPQRHYMAIGDDDQTIYEWRGASPQYILDFETRYGAQVFFMTENFRCPAAQVALANRVIEQNQQRQPKQMGLTRGFTGETFLHLVNNSGLMGRHIAGEISTALRNGFSPAAIAILVRIYAQTPPIEQYLIAAQIPYQVVGGEPFYERPEVRLLLNYCHVAQVEQNRRTGNKLNDAAIKTFQRAWFNIYNQPTRYLARGIADKIAGHITAGHLSVSRALVTAGHDVPDRTARALGRLADDIKWLAQMLSSGHPAETILRQLEERLQYMAYLKRSSTFPETGAAKAAGVATFLDYARGKGAIPQLLHHLEELAAAHAKVTADPNQPQVTITTMFRAKGLEWPLVFVPNCNDGAIPYERRASLEEERRLLYVAITRARQMLHLYTLTSQPLSPFLAEACTSETLTSIAAIQRALTTDPKHWRTEEMIALAVTSQRLYLADYFRYWWDAPAAQRQRIARLALRILDSIEKHNLRQKLEIQPGDESLWKELAGK